MDAGGPPQLRGRRSYVGDETLRNEVKLWVAPPEECLEEVCVRLCVQCGRSDEQLKDANAPGITFQKLSEILRLSRLSNFLLSSFPVAEIMTLGRAPIRQVEPGSTIRFVVIPGSIWGNAFSSFRPKRRSGAAPHVCSRLEAGDIVMYFVAGEFGKGSQVWESEIR